MVFLLAALLAGSVRPPAAYVDPGHMRLAVSSWCVGSRCGAPIAAAGKAVRVRRGATVSVTFTVVPRTVRVAVSGARLRVIRSGNEVAWTATRAGGMTINVTFRHGFAAYVGRILLR
jgi:hypothetical protein